MKASKIEEKIGYTHISFDMNQIGGSHEEFIEWMENKCIEYLYQVVFHFTNDSDVITTVIHDSFDWGMFKDGWALSEFYLFSVSNLE